MVPAVLHEKEKAHKVSVFTLSLHSGVSTWQLHQLGHDGCMHCMLWPHADHQGDLQTHQDRFDWQRSHDLMSVYLERCFG